MSQSVHFPRPPAPALNVLPPPAPYGRKPSRPASGPDLGAILDAFRRNIGKSIACLLAGVLLGLAFLAFAKQSFTASSSIFVDPRQRKIVNEEVMQGGIGNDAALFESQVNIIGSDSILRRVINTLKLDTDEDFVPPQRRGLLSPFRDALLGARPRPDNVTVALESLAKAIKVRRAQNTYVVNVDVTTGQPVKSATIANAVVNAYLDDQAAAKTDAAAKVNRMIDARLDELKEQVRSAEVRADEFKRQNKIVTSEGGLLNEQQLSRLNTELVAVRAQVATTKARLDEMNATLKRGISTESLPEAMTSPVVQRLRDQLASALRREASLSSQLQSRHPLMADAQAQTASLRNQIAAELQRIVVQTQNEHQIATAREKEILRTLARSEDEVAATTTAQIRLRELEREADASREVLRAFLARAKETQEQQNISVADARVITPAAVPSRPSSPNIPLVLALSSLLGLGLALANALWQSTASTARRVDDSRKLVLDGEAQALSSLGTIARLATGRMFGRGNALHDDAMASFNGSTQPRAVAFRDSVNRFAARLRAMHKSEPPQVVLFGSLAAGAGTSITALTTAYAQALSGTRTLLIDAAATDAHLSTLFAGDLQQDSPCVLDNKDHLANLTSRDPKSKLAFLPIALADLNNLSPGQRTRLANGIAKLATDYELVIIDGGQLTGDPTFAALAGAASEIVIVARGGTYDEARTQAALFELQIAPARVAGVLLTMTDAAQARA